MEVEKLFKGKDNSCLKESANKANRFFTPFKMTGMIRSFFLLFGRKQ